MDQPLSRIRSAARRGSTMVETMVALTLTMILLSLVGSTWVAMNRASVEVVVRYELVLEADLALARMADDLRGAQSTSPAPRQVLFGPNQLQIVDGTRIITYVASGGSLIRSVDPADEPEEVVGRHIESLTVQQPLGSGPVYQLTLVGAVPFPAPAGADPTLRRAFQFIAVMP